MQSFDNALDLFMYWVLNGECLSARQASALNAVEVAPAGECKGIKKAGSSNLFISDDMLRMKAIYLSLTPLQRLAIANEYSGRRSRPRTSAERNRLFKARRAFYIQYIQPNKKVVDPRANEIVLFI